jgi:hypothetical protein
MTIGSTAVDGLLIAGTLVAALIFASIVHEFGHALATSMVGNRVTSVTIGRRGPSLVFWIGSVETMLHLVPIGGMTHYFPTTRWRAVAAVSGGPFLNLAVGVGCLAASPSSGAISLIFAVFGWVNLLFAALNCIPMPASPPKKLATDGWQLGGLLIGTKETRAKRRLRPIANRAVTLELRPPGNGSAITVVRNPKAGVVSNPVESRMLALTLLRSSKAEEVLDGVEVARRLLEPTDDLVPETFGPSIRAGLANATACALVRSPTQDPVYLAQADRWASMACELRPDLPSSVGTLALVRIRQGKFREAEAMVRPLIATIVDDGERANCQTTLALALAGSGQYEEASELVARARRVDCDNPILIEAETAIQSSDCESGA